MHSTDDKVAAAAQKQPTATNRPLCWQPRTAANTRPVQAIVQFCRMPAHHRMRLIQLNRNTQSLQSMHVPKRVQTWKYTYTQEIHQNMLLSQEKNIFSLCFTSHSRLFFLFSFLFKINKWLPIDQQCRHMKKKKRVVWTTVAQRQSVLSLLIFFTSLHFPQSKIPLHIFLFCLVAKPVALPITVPVLPTPLRSTCGTARSHLQCFSPCGCCTPTVPGTPFE